MRNSSLAKVGSQHLRRKQHILKSSPEARSFRIILNSGGHTKRALSMLHRTLDFKSQTKKQGKLSLIRACHKQHTRIKRYGITPPHGAEHHEEEDAAIAVLGAIYCVGLASLEPEETCMALQFVSSDNGHECRCTAQQS